MKTQTSESEKSGFFGFTAKDEKDFQDCIRFCANELSDIIDVFNSSSLSRLDAGFEGVELGIEKATQGSGGNGNGSELTVSTEEDTFKPVSSKYLGILHLNNEKNSPYVKRGDEVKAGQTLAVVKTMNIMNTIKAPCKGVVSEILGSEGKPVEYGQILFLLKVV
ncbi:MAG: hypothetical protein LWY06_01380 [Firmicutes bacterium]|nr:hypothetical protein [Bacillota bacterium]